MEHMFHSIATFLGGLAGWFVLGECNGQKAEGILTVCTNAFGDKVWGFPQAIGAGVAVGFVVGYFIEKASKSR
jgi:hypothetical protein